ncbi:MAG: histidinol-phosphate aminotransferase family protein [Saprospiraceae bacterium]|nr:histidinol-phosphate aminotransferase family protein [Saprospiraceae bacterium]
MKDLTRRKWLQNSLLASSAFLISGSQTLLADTKLKSDSTNNGLIRLNWNENPYGPSPRAIQAVNDVIVNSNRYPDALIAELKELLASDHGLQKINFLITAGSTEVLSLLGQHVGLMNGEILTPYPSFPTMLRFGETCGASIRKVDLTVDHKIDLKAVLDAISEKTELIFICNPNNPTSTEVDHEELVSFCKSVPSEVLICVDEAYIEYSKNGLKGSMAPYVDEMSNLVICRTFSKAYGMAGLRIGYAISHSDNIVAMAIRHPGWELSTGVAPVAAALASYNDVGFLNKCISKNEEGRQIVYDAMDRWGIGYSPSSTNFIYVESSRFQKDVVSKLRKENVLITKWPDMKDHIRISIGKPDEMRIFVNRIEQYVIG